MQRYEKKRTRAARDAKKETDSPPQTTRLTIKRAEDPELRVMKGGLAVR